MVNTVRIEHGRHIGYSERGGNGGHRSVAPCWVAGPEAKVASRGWTHAHTH